MKHLSPTARSRDGGAEARKKRLMKRELGTALCLLLLTLGAAKAEPAATSGKKHLVFDVIRQGSKIGVDIIDIDKQGDATNVKCTTNISVKILGFEAYRYEHSASETWKGGQLVSFKSQTNDNGTKHSVAATQATDKLSLNVDGQRSDVPRDIMPATLWNLDFNKHAELFDPATGQRMAIKVEDLGEETLNFRGTQRPAHHYKITGEFDRELWFDGDVLLRMKIIGSDNSIVTSDLRQGDLADR
jgi:hypothetical protein